MEKNKNYESDLTQEEQKAQQESEFSFDVRTIFRLIVLNWQWFLVSLIIFISGALIYLRYKAPVYQMSAKMLIKDEVNNRRSNGQMLANMQDLGFMTNSTGIDNEVEILKSRILALEVVKDLKLYTEYRREGRVAKSLVYKYQPVSVDLDEAHLAKLEKRGNSLQMKLTKDGKNYHVEGINAKFECDFDHLPAAFRTPYGTLTFTNNIMLDQELQSDNDSKLSMLVTIYSPLAVASRYSNALTVAPTSKMTSIALLTLNDRSPERAFDYLKHLATCYNRQANADKNEIANKTEEFINSRLEKINAELGATESELEEYKRSNNLIQLKLDATQTMTQANQYYDQMVQASTQIQILDELRRHIENPANKYQIIPSNVGLSDAASSSLIAQYNQTVLERNRLLTSASENSPLVQTQTSLLDQLEISIREALRQARRTADIQHQGIERQYREFQTKVANTPEQERILTQIGRQQEVKSGLYLMLLQKREENSISLAATADKGRLIDDPAYGGKVSPKSSIILLLAIFLGFAMPLLVTYLIQLLRYKIEGHEDVARLTNLPILADVPVASESVKSSAGIVVQENKNNQIDEVFRSLRTNIQFMLKGDEKVILFTSSTSGEGKTFNAANLAVSFALLGKKVILVGADIRKPALGRLFGIADRNFGLTTLLAKDSASEKDLVAATKPSGINPNLSLLLAGPTPPNPTELLARESLGAIITMLREQYDYVILDTAPVGLVTDTMQLGKYADATVYVCRADYTPKSTFNYVNTLQSEEKLPNMCVIINGIDMSKKKYGYYYGYGRYGKYSRYVSYSRYGSYGKYGSYGSYGTYGSYGNYANSHYGKKDDDSIKR